MAKEEQRKIGLSFKLFCIIVSCHLLSHLSLSISLSPLLPSLPLSHDLQERKELVHGVDELGCGFGIARLIVEVLGGDLQETIDARLGEQGEEVSEKKCRFYRFSLQPTRKQKKESI